MKKLYYPKYSASTNSQTQPFQFLLHNARKKGKKFIQAFYPCFFQSQSSIVKQLNSIFIRIIIIYFNYKLNILFVRALTETNDLLQ